MSFEIERLFTDMLLVYDYGFIIIIIIINIGTDLSLLNYRDLN
jgi:hypothetical protein